MVRDVLYYALAKSKLFSKKCIFFAEITKKWQVLEHSAVKRCDIMRLT